ncbi:hypothetical protein ABS71_18930 [bacterium SCN 62-11]|nr:hypothetical protein [Candidatus Eremiobacteraeota bacterium]ODT58449.1 MAG: hypothetical protein ABS71_18930 [bacterium SCN 62-11]
MKKLIALLALTLSTNAWAQYGDFTGLDLSGMYNQQVQQSNAYFQNQTQQMVQANMANPQVQFAYQQYLAQGGQASFAQFAYYYAATGGFSRQGIQNYNQTSQSINAQQQNAWNGYQQAQQQSQQALQGWQNGYARNQNESGYNLTGQATYSTPAGAQVLNYTNQPGFYQQGGQNYYMDPGGNYYYVYPNGNMQPIQRGW